MCVLCSGLGIETVVVSRDNMDFKSDVSGVFLQYPDTQGSVYDLTSLVNKAHANKVRLMNECRINGHCRCERGIFIQRGDWNKLFVWLTSVKV